MENIDPSVYERADAGLLRLIEKAKIGALSEDEQRSYEASMKELEDEMDMEEHGFQQGVQQGIQQGIEIGREKGSYDKSNQIASDMKKKGFDVGLIHELTNLSLEEIDKL